MAKISILMPVYNAEKYLDECLTSIINQTFSDYEVLIINDGSADSSGWICDKYSQKDKRFQVRHQKNQGSGMARNDAIEWALLTDSEYITWVDSDDVIHPYFLECLYSTIVQHPECDMVQCRYTSNRDEMQRNVEESFLASKFFTNIQLLTEMLGGTYGIDFTLLWNKLYRKVLYVDSRIQINENFSGRMQDDVNILSLIYKQSSGCCLVDIKLYFYRVVKNSIQHKKIASVNLEYLYVYMNLYTDCKGTELDDYVDYLSERILFEIARKMSYKKSMYEDYSLFYEQLQEIFKVISTKVDFICKRKDLKILKTFSTKWFYAFRIYALMYNFRVGIKRLIKFNLFLFISII